MSTVTATREQEDLSPSGLTWNVRALHRPRVSLLNFGWIAVVAAFVLSLLGVATIGTTEPSYAVKHVAHVCVGMMAAGLVALPHYKHAQRWRHVILAIVLALLIFVLIPAVPESLVRPRHGARRWINLAVTDFQPSELAKIAYVIGLAAYLRYRRSYRTLVGLLLPLALTFVPLGLILVEPDLGTALLFLPTFFAMLIAAGAKLKHIVLIILLGLAVSPLMYPLLQDHQKDRIQALYYQLHGDERFVEDIGYQGSKAMMLIGAGGVTGVGRDRAADLITLNHLPEEHNDMVFAVVVCRWGLLGALLTWSAFALLALGGVLTAAMCKDPFGRLTAIGLVAILSAQMVINTGMTVGLLPITGMTLPFVSAGGTSVVAAWLMVGIMLNIAMRRPQYLTRDQLEFEFDDEDD